MHHSVQKYLTVMIASHFGLTPWQPHVLWWPNMLSVHKWHIGVWTVYVCVSDIAIDWSDHGLWWPDKNIWLARTRSTLDQYGVQADAKLWFTPMHKNLHVMLPDLQVLDMAVNFSTNVFSNVIRICRELGKLSTYCIAALSCSKEFPIVLCSYCLCNSAVAHTQSHTRL